MTKLLAIITLIVSLSVGVAHGQTCANLPNTLTNGTVADATQVMADFNYIVNCFGNMRNFFSGFTLSNDPTTPDTVIRFSGGAAAADNPTTLMKVTNVSTKDANAAWVVGWGAGCLDTGAALASNTWYHLYVIARSDTGVVDALCSTSAATPTMPTNYDRKRRIGSFKTDGSSRILRFIQNGDTFLWVTPVLDLDTTITDTVAHNKALTTPSGVPVLAMIYVQFSATSTGSPVLFVSSLFQTNLPASVAGGYTVQINNSGVASWSGQVLTTTNQEIRYRSSTGAGGTNIRIGTIGWIDTRGR